MANYSGKRDIGFSPLYELDNPPAAPVWVYGFYAFLLIALSGLLILVFEQSFPGLVIFWGGMALLIWAYFQQQRRRRDSQSLFISFAEMNDFTYTAHQEISIADSPGTLFAHGEAVSCKDIISGTLGDLPFALFNYHYRGGNKNNQNYDTCVFEITLPRKLPHMVIDSLVEEGNGGKSTLPITFDRSQRLDLEGDFYKYFTLYAPDTYAVSALTIIAPDAMEALMRHAALCDIEIIDNKLYFYWPVLPTTQIDYEETFATVQEVLKEIGQKLSKGNIFGRASQAKVHSESADHGVRLKSGVNYFALIGVAGMVIAFSLMGSEKNANAEGSEVFLKILLYVGVSIIPLGWGWFERVRRQRLRQKLISRYSSVKTEKS